VSKWFIRRNRLSDFIYNLTGFSNFNFELFELALTHRSASVYHGKGFSVNNERLEFLGDSILDAVISDFLYEKYPNENEGFLTGIRSRIVNRQSLNEIAQLIGLNNFIISNIKTQALPVSLMGNALEALIGAIFIDKGYYKTRCFIIEKLIEPHIDFETLCNVDSNFKGRIIDWAQKNKKEIKFSGTEDFNINKKPNHTYKVTVFIQNEEYGTGTADSKKEAEQIAAENALNKIIQT
jgi:ribonuclease III